jgi:hypothetical protein
MDAGQRIEAAQTRTDSNRTPDRGTLRERSSADGVAQTLLSVLALALPP